MNYRYGCTVKGPDIMEEWILYKTSLTPFHGAASSPGCCQDGGHSGGRHSSERLCGHGRVGQLVQQAQRGASQLICVRGSASPVQSPCALKERPLYIPSIA